MCDNTPKATSSAILMPAFGLYGRKFSFKYFKHLSLKVLQMVKTSSPGSWTMQHVQGTGMTGLSTKRGFVFGTLHEVLIHYFLVIL